MRNILQIFLFVICTLGTASIQGRDQFPGKRPKHAHIYCDTGILIDRGGNKWITTEVKLKSGEERHYFRVDPDLIDGKYYDCLVPPYVGQPERDSISCPDWPSNVLVGKTRVRVVYWWGNVQGRRDRISDEIFTLSEE